MTAKNFLDVTARRHARPPSAAPDSRVQLARDSIRALHCRPFSISGPGEQREIVILLGQTESVAEARLVVTRYRQISAVREAFEKVKSQWNELLATVEVRTPDAAMNVMMNRWLLYQALSCRIWARSAFYQSSGAYGFRDQLQDVMALVYAKPEIVREHILRAAGRQFPEGDVQHWWHPPSGRGLRTRFSDDPLWLPFVTSFYIGVTGDHTVLDEKVPFIEAPPLASRRNGISESACEHN